MRTLGALANADYADIVALALIHSTIKRSDKTPDNTLS